MVDVQVSKVLAQAYCRDRFFQAPYHHVDQGFDSQNRSHRHHIQDVTTAQTRVAISNVMSDALSLPQRNSALPPSRIHRRGTWTLLGLSVLSTLGCPCLAVLLLVNTIQLIIFGRWPNRHLAQLELAGAALSETRRPYGVGG